MIKAIIFDLDMCILNTHSMVGDFFKPVLDPLYNSDLTEEYKKKVHAQMWTTGLEDVVDMFSVPNEVAEPMREAYRTLEVPDCVASFGDEGYISELPTINILVTTGYKRFQSSKIELLKISHLFEEIIIDELDYREKRRGKKAIFKDLLNKYGWTENEVFVIGDNPHSELGVAKELGIKTVQTLRPTVVKWDKADYHINSFSELKALLDK